MYYQSASEMLELMPFNIKDSIDVAFIQTCLGKISTIQTLNEKLIQDNLKKGNDYFYDNRYNYTSL